MASLIFMLTGSALIVLVIRLIIKIIRGKPAQPSLKIVLITVAVYGFGWLFFYWNSKSVPVAFGTAVCFDDWCAMVTQTETDRLYKSNSHRCIQTAHTSLYISAC